MQRTELSKEEITIALATKPKVAIQGYRGAFHDIAVQRYFGNDKAEVAETDTFDQIVDKIKKNEVQFGAMAIENTIYGMLMPNYNLLNKANVYIDGEIYLRIKQNLIAWPGVKIEELKEVHSHPIAIEQCRDFFKLYPHIKLIESVDTAYSVKEIKEKKLKSRGAIASTLAADLYAMEILFPSIETNKKNFTRFLILEKKKKDLVDIHGDKASVIFTVSHEVGSLHHILTELANEQANLTKIQSIPILGKPFEYSFWVDFIAKDANLLNHAINTIRPLTHDLKVLGIYYKGKQHEH
jgi:prephenate dehydratase